MSRDVVYSGSFDPATWGHAQVLETALTRGYADRIIVSVVDSPDKTHFIDRPLAVRLFQLMLPPALQSRVDIRATSAREAINQSGATLRLKGARDPKDVEAEAGNIKKAMASAAARGDKPLDVLWVVDKAIPQEVAISSTAVRGLLMGRTRREDLLQYLPPIAVDVLMAARAEVAEDPEKDPETFRIAFNQALARALEHAPDPALASLPAVPAKPLDLPVAQRTHAEIAARLTGQIQLPKGHLHASSRVILDGLFGAGNYKPDDTRTVTLTTPETGIPVDIRVDRLSDCVNIVAQGFADWGIVSSGALEAWQKTRRETCERGGSLEVVANLGPAGCRWMVAIPHEFKYYDWTLFLEERYGGYIVTSNKEQLRIFLTRRGIDYDAIEKTGRIRLQKGGTERFSRFLMERTGKPVILHDVVGTGRTAFKHGFLPVLDLENNWSDEEEAVLLVRPVIKDSSKLGEQRFFKAIQDRREAIHHELVKLYLAKITAEENNSVALAASANMEDPNIVRRFISQRVNQITTAATQISRIPACG